MSKRVAWLAGLMLAAISPACPASAQTAPVESEIEAPGPDGALAGSFVDAGPGAPVILLIPGSGPTDRNGDSPGGVNSGAYRLLAEGLASQGVSSVRIDKRGMFGSKDAVADANQVRVSAYATDVRAWIGVIRERTGARCVWVAGHSEGGLVALTAAQQPEQICGVVLIAAAGRPVGVLIREQLRGNPANAPILDEALAALATLEAGKTVDTAQMAPTLANGLFAPQVQGYIIDLLAQRPAELAARYSGPVPVVSGGRDIQVARADADALVAAAPNATLLAFPEMTHMLKRVESDDRGANIATYMRADLPLMPGLAEGIADFVKRHSAH